MFVCLFCAKAERVLDGCERRKVVHWHLVYEYILRCHCRVCFAGQVVLGPIVRSDTIAASSNQADATGSLPVESAADLLQSLIKVRYDGEF